MMNAETARAGATYAPGLVPLRLHLPTFAEHWDRAHAGTTYVEVAIEDDCGTVLFRQEGVLAPASWSPRAVTIAASKYFYGDQARGDDPRAGGREGSVFRLHFRVDAFIATQLRDQGLVDDSGSCNAFADELLGITIGQYAAWNSPAWFNCGLSHYGIRGDDKAYAWDPDAGQGGAVLPIRDIYKHPQASACFIQGVEDDMESLMKLARNEAMLFKHGSGTGTDFSRIRSKREKLSGGGTPSGPVSFMRIYDRIASVVKSGGKTRRAAKMQTLGVWHPDILDFVRAKGREEAKAHALIAQGYDPDFNGEAYDTVGFQNANFSVRVTRDFLALVDEAGEGRVERHWPLVGVTTGEPVAWVDPLALWNAIAEETWRCGDPGMQFTDTINEWHTCPVAMDGSDQPIRSSNPCSEFLFIDDSACNLASINLLRFNLPGRFDCSGLKACVRSLITGMELLVDASSYPTRKIAQNSHDFRPLGLGFSNLGGLLLSLGVPYDGALGRAIGALLAAIVGGEAYAQSARLAAVRGPFPGYARNEPHMKAVIMKHRLSLIQAWGRMTAAIREGGLPRSVSPELLHGLYASATVAWGEAEELGWKHGYRNAQATCIAPTGTISFMMDCDTTGVEPMTSLRVWKNLAGGGGLLVESGLVPRALESLGYDAGRCPAILSYLAAHGTLEGCPWVDPDHLPVFDCALAPPGSSRTLGPDAHLGMMAAVQPFISGAISKTVNVPNSATVDDIAAIYRKAERMGLKCVAIYRDGSKRSQPLTPRGGEETAEAAVSCPKCGSSRAVPAGTCAVCTSCGEPIGGCS
jgi:ribonucleoside-diphosphate reductase alpha chain